MATMQDAIAISLPPDQRQEWAGRVMVREGGKVACGAIASTSLQSCESGHQCAVYQLDPLTDRSHPNVPSRPPQRSKSCKTRDFKSLCTSISRISPQRSSIDLPEAFNLLCNASLKSPSSTGDESGKALPKKGSASSVSHHVWISGIGMPRIRAKQSGIRA